MFQGNPEQFKINGTGDHLPPFYSVGGTRIEIRPDNSVPLKDKFAECAKKPEATINEQNFDALYGYKNPDPLYAANHSPYSEYSKEGSALEEKRRRLDYIAKCMIRGLELSTTEIIDRLIGQANQLQVMMSHGDDFFMRVTTDEDKLYVTNQNGQIAFSSKGAPGAYIASAQDKAILEEESDMCIIGLSKDEVDEDGYITSNVNEKTAMEKSIDEINNTAERLKEISKTRDLTSDDLTPYGQYLVVREAAPTTTPALMAKAPASAALALTPTF